MKSNLLSMAAIIALVASLNLLRGHSNGGEAPADIAGLRIDGVALGESRQGLVDRLETAGWRVPFQQAQRSSVPHGSFSLIRAGTQLNIYYLNNEVVTISSSGGSLQYNGKVLIQTGQSQAELLPRYGYFRSTGNSAGILIDSTSTYRSPDQTAIHVYIVDGKVWAISMSSGKLETRYKKKDTTPPKACHVN